jgi:predicted nucleotidyltransferase
MKNWTLCLAALLLGLVVCTMAQAETPRQAVDRMAATGIGHGDTNGRAENAFFSQRHLFPRVQAAFAYAGSPGHSYNAMRAPVRVLLFARVKHTPAGVTVVGRGRH